MAPFSGGDFPRRKRPIGPKWHIKETYIKVAGHGKYFYRVVDSASYTVDFLLTAKRDLGTARRFLERAITLLVVPEKITIDKCGANTAAIRTVYAHSCVDILMRQNKHLNNTVEQDHRVQTTRWFNIGFQVILERAKNHRRHRNHEYDLQEVDGLPRQLTHVRSEAVLKGRCLISNSAEQPFSARLHYCDRTL